MGLLPPFVGEAVNVTDDPEQTAPEGLALIEVLTVFDVFVTTAATLLFAVAVFDPQVEVATK